MTLSSPVLILDGGLGTTLEDEHDIKFDASTPLWSSHLLISSPDTLAKVHSDFVEAGADIILTATYQASVSGFEKTVVHGQNVSEEQAKQYMRDSVKLARSVFTDSARLRGRSEIVALSLGAYGATTAPSAEYSGDYGEVGYESLCTFHGSRLSMFKSSPKVWDDVDMLAFETLPRLDEIRAVKTIIRVVADKPYWISCVFPKPDDNLLPDGSTVSEVVEVMLSGGRIPEAVGINCTKIWKIDGLVKEFEAAIDDQDRGFPKLILYPDGAGDQIYNTTLQQWVMQRHENGTVTKAWDEMLADIVRSIQERGKWKGIIVGGCCKASPTMIGSLRHRLCKS